MVKGKKQVIWDDDARMHFKLAIAYIKKQSVQNAVTIRSEILTSTKSLGDMPERLHTQDKYRRNNDGSFRAYEIYHFRISYFVKSDQIRIVRFRHTSQQPEMY